MPVDRPADRRRAGDGDQQALRPTGKGGADRAADLHPLHGAGRVDLQTVPAADGALHRACRPTGSCRLRRRASRTSGRTARRATARAQRRRERVLQQQRDADHGDREVGEHLLRRRSPTSCSAATCSRSSTWRSKLGMTSLVQRPAGAGVTVGQAILQTAARSNWCSAACAPARSSWPAPTRPSPTAACTTRRRRSVSITDNTGHAGQGDPLAGQAGVSTAGGAAGGSRSSPATPPARHLRRHLPTLVRPHAAARSPARPAPRPASDGKTKQTTNGAIWFVGMTPKLVATTALINLDHPSEPASDLPGAREREEHRVRLVRGRGLARRAAARRCRPVAGPGRAPTAAPGVRVPDVVGHEPRAARSTLKRHGFKMQQLDAANGLLCRARSPLGAVAYYGAAIAPARVDDHGLPASGTEQPIWVTSRRRPPPPPPAPPTTPRRRVRAGRQRRARHPAADAPEHAPEPRPTSHSGRCGTGGSTGNSRGGG